MYKGVAIARYCVFNKVVSKSASIYEDETSRFIC